MFEIKEKIEKYKPLKKGHRFLKPNAQGQVPLMCVNFNNFGKHCCRILNPDAKSIDDVKIEEKDCICLKGEFCEVYR